MDVKITFNDFTVTGANQLNNVTIKLLKGEKGDPGEPTDAQVQTSVNTWLAAHPEATTTVQDGAISYAKLDSTLKAKADDVDDLKSSIGDLNDLETDDTENIVAAINWLYENGGGTPAPTYTITNKLTNVTNSNGATSIREGKAYSATLALAEDAVLDSVTVTMGGTDITATAWDATNMTVSIASVTNSVVITAKALIVKEITVTWSGSGTEKTSSLIDATADDVYFTVPFVEGATQLAEGVTASSNAVKFVVKMYSDSSASTLVGYYYFSDGATTTSQRTGLQSSIVKFDTEYMVVPYGYYVKLAYFNNCSAFNSNDASSSYLTRYAKITLKQHEEEEQEEVETLTNAEKVDADLLRNYTLNAVSLTTDTAEDATSYNGVIEEAKNAWMTEYGGNIDKIPLIIHTDQHSSMTPTNSSAMWEAIDGMVSWYDVSKVINLGDTTNSYENFDNPLLGDGALEKYLEATEHIPWSKRIEVFGNHDCMQIRSASLTYIPQAPNYLNPYFKNVMARRTSNNGNWCVTYDDYFNVKYVIYSTYDWLESLSDYGVTTEQYDFLIDELSKNDGYDVILLGHTDVNIWQENTGKIAKARYEKTSGSFTDKLGVTHTYDFTQCENDLLVCLHGHSHDDGYNYTETVLSQCFANYYDSTRPIYFVIVDRANRQIKIWKVTNTPEYTLTTRTLTEAATE